MKYVIILLVMALAMPLVALDPYIMTLEECRAYIKANNLKWEAGVTPYTNMPKETLKMMLTGMYLPIESKTKNSNHIVNSNTKNPEYLDWTNVGGTNWMTSVKNQASCGSCWAFAVMGTWEAMININSNNSNIDWDASEQYMVSTCYSGGSCGGGPAGTGPANWVKANGVPDEACYPYKAANSNCNERCSDWASRLKYIKTVTSVCTSANTEAIKAALRNGPVGTAMQATAMMLRFYKGGTLGEEAPSLNIGYPLNHGVVIVGWDDARNGGSWKWKNSWGTGWGEQGYGWTRFGTSEMGAYTWSCTAFSEGSQKSITVTYPNGGERLQGNSQIYIRWTTTGTINLVDLFLTTNSGSSWAAIATRQNNNGSYGWTVPNIDAISCKIRVKDSEDTGTTAYDDSDRTFEIYKSTGFKYAKDAMYLPSRLSLSVSPSPFFSSAKVSFNLPVSDKVVIEVYDIQGRLAKKMTSAYYNAGSHTIIWNANDLPTGAYIVKMFTNNTTITRNILHLK